MTTNLVLKKEKLTADNFHSWVNIWKNAREDNAENLQSESTPLSDTDISNSIENILGVIPFLPRASVKVMVKDGWVKLTGSVDWEYQKHATTNTICNLQGIKGISNHIAVNTEFLPNDSNLIIQPLSSN